MKLVAKLTAALVLTAVIVLGLFAAYSVHRERGALDAQRRRTEHLILHTLSAAVVQVWRHDGEGEAMKLITDADAHGDGLRLRWVWLDAPPGAADAPMMRLDAEIARDERELFRVEQGGSERVFVYSPLDVGAPRRGAIELSQSIDEEAQFLSTSVVSAAITGVALVLVNGAAALWLGVFFVGRPVRRIVEKTQRVGEGELGTPLVLGQKDELGRVAAELNRMCERLLSAREGLSREVAARISALEQLRHAERLVTVGKLASGLAHELGTPLNVVGGRAKRVLRRDGPKETHDDARVIVEQTDRMTRIIRQLLDFARRRGAQKAPGDLAAVIRGVVQMLEPIARKSGVAVRFDPPGPARAEIDAGQMEQVFTNLVMNGIQAMDHGGELSVTVDRTPEHVVVRVRDQGPGIRPEHLPHVFEPFFTTKDVGQGTGLGLSVSWGLVEEHGGWIEAASEPGSGATFTVYLPAR